MYTRFSNTTYCTQRPTVSLGIKDDQFILTIKIFLLIKAVCSEVLFAE